MRDGDNAETTLGRESRQACCRSRPSSISDFPRSQKASHPVTWHNTLRVSTRALEHRETRTVKITIDEDGITRVQAKEHFDNLLWDTGQ